MNVKAGDFAEVIKSFRSKSVGTIVKVLSYQGRNEKYGDYWLIGSSDDNPLETYLGDVSPLAHAPDDWLRKVDPPKPSAEPRVAELNLKD